MKTNYEERKAARLDRLEELAQKNESLSNSLYNQAMKMADVIPLGQPILIGHHSEKRDRNYREKIHNTMSKSVEAQKKAEYYKERAESLLSNTAISSDDPNAIDKLQEKLERLEATQELYKAINKIIKGKQPQAEKVEKLMALGLREATAIKLFEPDFCGRVGVPSYKLTNNNAVISNTRKRIEQLTKVAAIETSEEVINGVTLKINSETNRVQLFFSGIPVEGIRTELKHNGFHWSRFEGCWMRQISNSAVWAAKQILNRA